MAQHWVPQHILRGFSADGKMICQYDKTGEVPAKKVAIRGACGRNDAFSEPVERLLATIEGAANPALDVFRRMEGTTRIDAVAKRIVAVYLNMFLWKRSPATRDRQIADTNEVELLRSVRDRAERYGLLLDTLLALAEENATDVNSLMAQHWKANIFLRWLHYSMSWAVLQCAEPIVMVPDCGMFRSSGLFDPDVQCFFPLSSTRVLVASWSGTPTDLVQLISMSPTHVRQINKLGFIKAGRFVYGQEYSAKVAEAVSRRSQHFESLGKLRPAGGLNPMATKLDSLRKWHAANRLDVDRYFCIAPSAGEAFRHDWQQVPSSLHVVSERQDVRTPVRICRSCYGIERRYPTGHLEFEDLELLRTTIRPPLKNWWQKYSVEEEGSRLEATEWEPSDTD